MKKQIFKSLAFLMLNVCALAFHAFLFRTDMPYLAFGSAAIHVVSLIFFPYNKILSK